MIAHTAASGDWVISQMCRAAPSKRLGDSPATGSVEGPKSLYLSTLSGFPELVVPAGFTSDKLPVGISFLGGAFTEAKLLALGYGFEQASQARRLPRHTPLLPERFIRVPCHQEC